MSEPLKKPTQAPESYTPKEVPAIIGMARQAHDIEEGPDAPASSSSGGGSNQLPDIRSIINGMEGKNYGLNDCLAFLMERLGRPELDYWLLTGVTGNDVAMVYNRNPATLCEYCVSGYLAGPEYIGSVFDAIGCAYSYATAVQINADKAKYLRMVTQSIDRGIPVLVKTNLKDVSGVETDVLTYCLLIGYEDGGNTLRFLWQDKAKLGAYDTTGEIKQDWIFCTGEKPGGITAAEIARNAVMNMSHWLTLPEKDGMLFGASAFRAWADDIETGRYDNESDLWGNYCVYVCSLATNSGGCQRFMRKALELNPDLAFLEDACRQYRITGMLWNTREDADWYYAEHKKRHGSVRCLEKLGGGFNIKLKTLQNSRKRAKIAAVIRQCAGCMDEAVRILTPEGYTPKEVPAIVAMARQAHDIEEGPGAPASSSSSGGGMLPHIRGICDGMKGHNYALPDCLAFIWERLDEAPALDFWRFAAITGDTVAQVYNRNPSTRCDYCVSGYLAGPEHIAYVFGALGYGHEYVTAAQINADKENYLRQLVSHIDRGLPVLVRFHMADVPGWDSDVGTWSLVVGYAGEGNTLLLNFGCLNGDGEARLLEYDASGEIGMDWIFVGEKQREITQEEIVLRAIKMMPHWLALPGRDGMFFGAAAFRAWADDIEAGRYEDEGAGLWDDYGVYVCNLATSGGEPTYLFRQLAELNPQYAHYIELGEKIQRLLPAETPTGGKTLDWIRLDKLKGGLDAERKILCDKKKRGKIAAVLRERADHLDEALRLLSPEAYTPKEAPQIISMAKAYADQKEGSTVAIEPSIATKQFCLVGAESQIDFGTDFNPALQSLYRQITDHLSEMHGLAQPVRVIGYWYYPTPGNFNDVHYFAGVEADAAHVPAGLAAKTLPESLYAVFAEERRGLVGGPEGAGYKWLNQSKEYTYNGAIPGDLEVYRNLTDTAPDCLAEIYIPITGVESYSPKETPEIIGLARQAQNQTQEENAMQQPEIITRKFLLAGFEAAIELNDAHWPGMDYAKAALKENLHKLGNLAQPPRFFDVWEADPNVNYKKKKNHSRRLFFFGAEVTSLDGIPEGFVTKDFPETTWAVFKEREHGHAKFEALAAAGYKLDGAYAEKYAMDMEIYGDIEDEGPQWDALIPVEKR